SRALVGVAPPLIYLLLACPTIRAVRNHLLRLIKAVLPPVRLMVMGPFVPGLSNHEHLAVAARGGRRGAEPFEFLIRQTLELILVEARKLIDAIARQVGHQHLALAIEPRMADRQQELLRSKPAPGVDYDVVRAA